MLGVNAALVQRSLIHGKAAVQPQRIKAKQDFQKKEGYGSPGQETHVHAGRFYVLCDEEGSVWGQRGGAGRCSVVACFIPCHVSSLTLPSDDTKSQANAVL